MYSISSLLHAAVSHPVVHVHYCLQYTGKWSKSCPRGGLDMRKKHFVTYTMTTIILYCKPWKPVWSLVWQSKILNSFSNCPPYTSEKKQRNPKVHAFEKRYYCIHGGIILLNALHSAAWCLHFCVVSYAYVSAEYVIIITMQFQLQIVTNIWVQLDTALSEREKKTWRR